MTLIIICLFVSVAALLYYRAKRIVTQFMFSIENYEYTEDPHAELFWGSGIYRLSEDQTRIIDSTTGGSFPAVRSEIAEIKKITRLTCAHCDKLSCPFRGDEYNKNGNCLASK